MPVSMIETPVSDLVRGRVPLKRDRALRRDQHAADAFRDEGSEEVVHWQEGEPQTEVFADAEHVDLLGLVDRQFVEQPARGLRGMDTPLPTSSLGRHRSTDPRLESSPAQDGG